MKDDWWLDGASLWGWMWSDKEVRNNCNRRSGRPFHCQDESDVIPNWDTWCASLEGVNIYAMYNKVQEINLRIIPCSYPNKIFMLQIIKHHDLFPVSHRGDSLPGRHLRQILKQLASWGTGPPLAPPSPNTHAEANNSHFLLPLFEHISDIVKQHEEAVNLQIHP